MMAMTGLLLAAAIRASSFGFDPADSTAFLQAALRSGAKRVVIDKRESPWLTGMLKGVSNVEIVFEPGAVIAAKPGAFAASDASLADIRRICLRGLQMCAHEIVMDCPFYEQQMYPGDTRVQLQVQGAVSSDARLRRRAIGVFDRARRADGFVPMNFPSRAIQDCAPFTMCHVLMHGDYVKWCGGDAWLKARLPGLTHAMAALAALENADGLLKTVPGWRFYDWAVNTRGWWSRGHAGNTEDGPAALDNLFYVLALEAASETGGLRRSRAGGALEAACRADAPGGAERSMRLERSSSTANTSPTACASGTIAMRCANWRRSWIATMWT